MESRSGERMLCLCAVTTTMEAACENDDVRVTRQDKRFFTDVTTKKRYSKLDAQPLTTATNRVEVVCVSALGVKVMSHVFGWSHSVSHASPGKK